jgi:2-succinyl-5-enolpyruvyl-6-hydroxy-3-cyclohexene-1-carboxylate synthase
MEVSTACARTLVDELARAGLTDAVLAPGSRSAPLALALADDDRIRLHVHLDERSAAFFALGAAKASGRPTLVLCTSGTAAAHFHPAVLEADHSRVPLIVCTADRPAELRATGAPQTTDQVHLYGAAVRFFADIPADGAPAARAAWRPIAARLWAEAAGPPAGPVHLNVAFREPLVPMGDDAGSATGRMGAARGAGELAEVGGADGRETAAGEQVAGNVGAADERDGLEPGRDGGRPWVVSHRALRAGLAAGEAAEVTGRIRAAERGLVVAGWGSPAEAREVAAFLRWPLLADAISGQRHCRDAVTTYEALLRVPGFAESHRPDLVIRFGGPLTSKAAMAWLDASVHQILIDPDGAWLDPHRAVADRMVALPDLRAVVGGDAERRSVERVPTGRGDLDSAVEAWHDAWLRAEEVARRALDAFLDADDEPFEGRVARDVAAACAASGRSPALVVASSMPVRDLEAFAGPVPHTVYANRGVNGIDGLISTVLGVAAGARTAAGARPPAGARSAGGPDTGSGAAASGGPAHRGVPGPAVVGLLGDLAFLHDAGGLLGAPSRGLHAVFVVVDNGGGGIFSFLPQAALPTERFELLFGTPPGADVTAVAVAYGVPAERVERAAEVGPALEGALATGGVRVLVVPTGDRTANVDRHRQAWAAVAEAIAKAQA